ncbi:uncharacterized protein LTHEOB_2004 [Lasiodiplodia theobromae]|uniref:uncharacterized protein n=1 Tax=Lasiodiplodia theobromae TaxID=45133 RepID=UPI0015C34C47|nr:uncharacterized protein LTHEOB_2004 [Lasiodiplodia theobromae]KAF4536243.1 hypothetical protein LTHEOB_2004 [Lasiodiplodia theobromae]
MTETLANLFARLSGLLPQSVSDQASKMFVKRLLKHFFDRLEELLAQMCWAALAGLFQAFWLLVFQNVAGRAASAVTSSAATSPAPSSKMSSSRASSTPPAAVAAAPAPDVEGLDCASSTGTGSVAPTTLRDYEKHVVNQCLDCAARPADALGTEDTSASTQEARNKGKMPARPPSSDSRGSGYRGDGETGRGSMSPETLSKHLTSAFDRVVTASQVKEKAILKEIGTRMDLIQDLVTAHKRLVDRRLAFEGDSSSLKRSRKFENLRELRDEARRRGMGEESVVEGGSTAPSRSDG